MVNMKCVIFNVMCQFTLRHTNKNECFFIHLLHHITKIKQIHSIVLNLVMLVIKPIHLLIIIVISIT